MKRPTFEIKESELLLSVLSQMGIINVKGSQVEEWMRRLKENEELIIGFNGSWWSLAYKFKNPNIFDKTALGKFFPFFKRRNLNKKYRFEASRWA